jgi:hypothetical protein
MMGKWASHACSYLPVVGQVFSPLLSEVSLALVLSKSWTLENEPYYEKEIEKTTRERCER